MSLTQSAEYVAAGYILSRDAGRLRTGTWINGRPPHANRLRHASTTTRRVKLAEHCSAIAGLLLLLLLCKLRQYSSSLSRDVATSFGWWTKLALRNFVSLYQRTTVSLAHLRYSAHFHTVCLSVCLSVRVAPCAKSAAHFSLISLNKRYL